MSGTCIDADTAAAFTSHALSPSDAAQVSQHIDTCSHCRVLISELARTDWTGEATQSGPPGAGASPVLARGTRVGPYEVLEPLEAGGMGVIYTAYDARLDRRVALKAVRDLQTDPALLLREAKLMAQLAHPNVVPVYDVLEAGGQHFLAMELVRGTSLRQWLEAAPRSWGQVVDVFLEAGQGLAAAHEAGIVHGDVKPGNVLVGDDGRVRVTDFGLARTALEEGVAGVIRGTPAFFAPEQKAGAPPDALADQYAFCVSLHEALFGAFPGSPAKRSPRLPRGVRRALSRGLEETPAARFPSMRALLAALRSARSARLKWLVAAAAVGTASVALAWVGGGRRVEAAQCEEAAATLLAPPWTEKARAQVHHAFTATKLPYAEASFTRVEANLDAFAAAFEQARAKACAADWFSRSVPSEQLAAKLRCLGEAGRELRGLVGLLREADTAVVLNAVAASDGVRTLERCEQLPPAPATLAEGPILEALRDDFARAHQLLSAGRAAEALPISRSLLERAEAQKAPALIAAAKVSLAIALQRQGDLEGASLQLRQALRLAELAQDDRVRAQAWSTLVQNEFKRGRAEQALLIEEPALGAAERIGDVQEQTEILLMAGGAASQLGQVERAQARFEQALQLRLAAFGPDDRRTAAALSAVGNALAMKGDLVGGSDAHRRALAAGVAALGPSHPNVGTFHGNLGDDYLYDLKPEPAVAELSAAVAIFEAINPMHRDVASNLTDLGFAQLLGGAPEAALASLEKACAIWAKVGATHPVHGMALLGRFQALAALGRPGAVADLEAALGLSKALPPFERGRVQRALAEALRDDPARAQTLMKQALEGLSTTPLPLVAAERARAQAWLDSHPGGS